jgi:energy-coupling factor transporter ATP-binding protein EcfA2
MNSFFRIHSGGVVRNGLGALLVGPSGSGKSTLVVRLVMNGFSLLSDDEVWVDPESLLLHPNPRYLLLKESAWDLFPAYREKFVRTEEKERRSWWLHSQDLRPGCRAAPTPLWALICLRPRVGDRPSLEEIGQTEALSTIMRECMNFSCEGRLSVLLKIVNVARLFKLNIGDLNECAELLSRVLP